MFKFCGNCGAPADDNAMVCGKCGTPFAPVQPNYQPPVQPGYQAPVQPTYQAPVQPTYQAPVQPTYQAPVQQAYQPPVQPGYNPMPGAPAMNQNIPGVTNNGTKKNGFIPKIIAAVLAVVILIVGVSAIFGGSGYKGVVKDFAKAVETGDGKKLAKKLYKDAFIDEEYIMEFFDEINEELCEEFDSKKIKTSYKITDTEDVSKSDMEYAVGVEKEGIIVWFDLTVEGNGDKETYRSGIAFVKDGGWKIADLGIGDKY